MYIQELTIEIKTDFDKNHLVEEFQSLVYCFRKSGQSQTNDETSFIIDNVIKCNIATLEKTSLDKKYNAEWVTRQLEKLEKLCGQTTIPNFQEEELIFVRKSRH